MSGLRQRERKIKKKKILFLLSDAGQPGTEIFNMPASTTAGREITHQFAQFIVFRGACKGVHLEVNQSHDQSHAYTVIWD